MGRDQGWGRVVKAFSKNTPPPVRHHGLILIRPASSRVSQISLQGGIVVASRSARLKHPLLELATETEARQLITETPWEKRQPRKQEKMSTNQSMLNTYKQLFKDNETPVNIIPELAFVCVEGESEQSGGLAILTNIYMEITKCRE